MNKRFLRALVMTIVFVTYFKTITSIFGSSWKVYGLLIITSIILDALVFKLLRSKYLNRYFFKEREN